VGVEADGSAFFRAPAGVPLSFQALDGRGLAVQVMRSITYLQSGEAAACIGCHESRTTAPPPRPAALALARPPSVIEPGPDGSKPLSFPILVQPVLDRRCVSCHGGEKPDGDLRLGGEPEGRYTVSYNALAPRVPFSEWTGRADFLQANCEPLSLPGRFGSGGSALLKKLLEGHHDVVLDPGEVDRLATWMDANALFYGTFDPAAQARQLLGERIEGPGLE
jgi:mono/diheme cytochrome c family protein